MGYYDFPHTRNYDSDLGFLIKKYKDLQGDYETLIDIYNIVNENIKSTTLEQLKTWLDDGTLENLINAGLFESKVGKYDTVTQMIADTELSDGNIVMTAGYYTVGDGGNNHYRISNEQITTNDIQLANDKYAVRVDTLIDVKKLGAKGDGVTDDLPIFNKAIAMATNGEVIFIPSGNYLLNGTLTIDKPITLQGTTVQNDTQNNIPLKGSVLLFTANSNQDNAINITVNGVQLKGLSLKNNSANSQYIKYGVRIPGYIGDLTWNITCENLVIDGFVENGIYATNLLLSQFKNLYISNCKVGLKIDGTTSTSILIERVWAFHVSSSGFSFNVLTYSSLIDCACDDCGYAYYFTGCFSVSMINCGMEYSDFNPIFISNSKGITINGCRSFACNRITTNATSYLQAFNSDVFISSCTEQNSRTGSTYSISSNNSNIDLINCNFENDTYTPGFNGTLKEILAPLPQANIDYQGQFISIQSNAGYTLPGDSSNLWVYCILTKSGETILNLYSTIAQGGTEIAPSTQSAYGFCWRIK